MKVALITGITGQDGSYLAELLLEKGYEVHGIKRRASSFNTQRIDHLYRDRHDIENETSLAPHHSSLFLHYGDLTDSSNLTRILEEVKPDEVYNLGAQSHVAVSFESPEYTADVDAMGTLRLLEAIGIIESLSTSYASLSEGSVIVRIDPRYFRPAEVETLLGDPSKAKADLGWVPEITLDEMVEEMVAHDLDLARRHALLKANGYRVEVSKES